MISQLLLSARLRRRFREWRIALTRDPEIRRLRRREAELIAKLADSAILSPPVPVPTDFFLARPSALSGIARLLDLGATYDILPRFEPAQVIDAQAIFSDWSMVGQDLRDAAKQLEDSAEHLSQRLAEVDAGAGCLARDGREAGTRGGCGEENPLVGTLGIVVKGRGGLSASMPAARSPRPNGSEGGDRVAGRPLHMIAGGRLNGFQEPKERREFPLWLRGNADVQASRPIARRVEPSPRVWLLTLSQAGAIAFTLCLVAFCAGMFVQHRAIMRRAVPAVSPTDQPGVFVPSGDVGLPPSAERDA